MKQIINNCYFIDVEIKNEVYFSVFSQMSTMNMIYFCNEEKIFKN